MKKKNPNRVYSLWTKLKKVLGGIDAQNFILLQRSSKGSREGTYFIRGSFVIDGVKKTIRLMIMPHYIDDFGISSEYRDELTFIAKNTNISARAIKSEINRLVEIWDLGKSSETVFKSVIIQSYMCADVSKSSVDDDRNNHIDYFLTLYTEDSREGPRVSVDVKSSLPAHLPRNTLVYLRDDGVYEVDANETTIAAHPGWANAVILEILHLENSVK